MDGERPATFAYLGHAMVDRAVILHSTEKKHRYGNVNTMKVWTTFRFSVCAICEFADSDPVHTKRVKSILGSKT